MTRIWDQFHHGGRENVWKGMISVSPAATGESKTTKHLTQYKQSQPNRYFLSEKFRVRDFLT